MKKSSAPPSGQIRLERAKRLRPSCSSSPKLSNDTKLGHGARLFCRCDHRDWSLFVSSAAFGRLAIEVRFRSFIKFC